MLSALWCPAKYRLAGGHHQRVVLIVDLRLPCSSQFCGAIT